MLENRLEKANQKFNESIGSNKTIRSEIDQLRKDKTIFENMYSKLESQLSSKRAEIGLIVDTANSAYEERDKVQAKIANLIQSSMKEQTEFNSEIQAVQDLIEKDDSMQNKITQNIKAN